MVLYHVFLFPFCLLSLLIFLYFKQVAESYFIQNELLLNYWTLTYSGIAQSIVTEGHRGERFVSETFDQKDASKFWEICLKWCYYV